MKGFDLFNKKQSISPDKEGEEKKNEPAFKIIKIDKIEVEDYTIRLNKTLAQGPYNGPNKSIDLNAIRMASAQSGIGNSQGGQRILGDLYESGKLKVFLDEETNEYIVHMPSTV